MWTILLVHLWEGHPSAIATPLMTMEYPPIPLTLGSLPVGGIVAEGIKVTGVEVTPMELAPSRGDERKRMGFLVRSKYPYLGARRVILMMWPMPSGSEPAVSCIIMITMRIPTSCPWWCHLSQEMHWMCLTGHEV